MDTADVPVDVTHLSRPDETVFRTIAAALGARYAGDELRLDEVAPEPVARAAAADPRSAALLDRIPVATIVADGDAVAHLNRAAQARLGYPSAEALAAAGGLDALFRKDHARHGAMLVATASGALLPVRVRVAPIAWGEGRAMLVTIETDAAVALHAGAAGSARSALEQAASDVRRLVHEATVLIVLDGTRGDDMSDAAVRFWRSLLLAIVTRALAGSVLTVREDWRATVLTLAPHATLPFDRALGSPRLAGLAAAAGLALGSVEGAFAVRIACSGGGRTSPTDPQR